jgi:hypothetical protein
MKSTTQPTLRSSRSPAMEWLIFLALVVGLPLLVGWLVRLVFDPLFGLADGLESLPWYMGSLAQAFLAGLAFLVEAFLAVFLILYAWRRPRMFWLELICFVGYVALIVYFVFFHLEMQIDDLVAWMAIVAGLVNAHAFRRAVGYVPLFAYLAHWGHRVFGETYRNRSRRMRSLQLRQHRFAHLRFAPWLFLVPCLILVPVGAFTHFLYVAGVLSFCAVLTWSYRTFVSRPPGLLFLGPSSEESLLTAKLLHDGIHELRIVSLLDTAKAESEQTRFYARLSWLDTFREEAPGPVPLEPEDEGFSVRDAIKQLQSMPDYNFHWRLNWRIVMRQLTELARVVVIDGRTHTKWLSLELIKLLKSGRDDLSVILLVDERGESPLLDWLRQAREVDSEAHEGVLHRLDELQEQLQEFGDVLGQIQVHARRPKPIRSLLGERGLRDTIDALKKLKSRPIDFDMPVLVSTKVDMVETIRKEVGLPGEPARHL